MNQAALVGSINGPLNIVKAFAVKISANVGAFVGAGNIRWTMPKSSGAPPDHDMGAIEAVVKETARGRAFLAYYARRYVNPIH